MGFRCSSHTRTVTGGFGAVDQIYPHELAHVIYQQLAGARPPAYTSQIHAAGVRTDPITAFDEGFASHLQAMAILQGAPYITLDDLQRVPGMTPAVMKQFRSMAEGMDRPDHVMDTLLVSLGWYALSFMLLAWGLAVIPALLLVHLRL